jgi:hypothetical protein
VDYRARPVDFSGSLGDHLLVLSMAGTEPDFSACVLVYGQRAAAFELLCFHGE